MVNVAAKTLAVVGVSLLALMVGCMTRETYTQMSNIQLIPEPTLSSIRDDSYAVNAEAMKTSLNNLFAGKTAQEVLEILEAENVEFKFASGDEMLVFPRKSFPAVLASYSCVATLAFEDGAFAETKSISLCGLDAV